MSVGSTSAVGAATPPPASPRPARAPGPDVARCLAILSMVYVNFEVVLAGGSDHPAWLRTLASAFEGNASALFVMLAGMGLVLLGRRATILKRALLLLVLGYLWQVLWPGDILHYYAYYLAVGALLLAWRAWALWLLAAVCTGVWVVLFRTYDYGVGWDWMSLSHPQFWTADGQLRNLVFNGWHPLFPWLAFLLTGMALAKWGFSTTRQRRTVLALSAVLYAAALGLSQHLGALPDERPVLQQFLRWYGAPDAFWGTDSIPPGPLYVLSAGAVAAFVIALCIELTALPAVARGTRWLARCGQLALTCYLVHVLFLYFVVMPAVDALASSGGPSPLEMAAGAALLFGVLSVAFANLWLKRFRRGPLEWVLRKLCG